MRTRCFNCYRKHVGMAHVFWELSSIASMGQSEDPESQLDPKPISILIEEHFAQAQILYSEFQSGDYDAHFWLAMGHIAVIEFVLFLAGEDGIAEQFRDERLNSISEEGYVFQWEKLRDIIYSEVSLDMPEFGHYELMILFRANIKEALSESRTRPSVGLEVLARDMLDSDAPDFVYAIEAATKAALQEEKKTKKTRKGSKPSKGRDADLP